MATLYIRCDCGERLRLKSEYAGRTGRCKKCDARIAIPAAHLFEQVADREVSLGELATLGDEALVETTPRQSDSAPRNENGLTVGLWQPGQLVDGRYQVEKKLGKGGCGIVWKVKHTEWNLDLAVKEFIDDSNLKPQTREKRRTNFVRESQAWVDDVGMHPHVVTAWYVRELNGTPYLFLEYCDGGDLADWIDQGKTRDLKIALDIAIQLAWGLAHCHEKGIVHRDFKPQNVMMTADGTAKITDFGMVKFAAIDTGDEDTDDEVGSTDIRQTLGGGIRGTPPYMPPEQWSPGGQIDQRADLYALGVTIHELLTGSHPIIIPSRTKFPNQRVWLESCAEAHVQDRPLSLSQHRDDVPTGLEQLVQQCLTKSPNDRPTGADAVVRALQQIYEAAHGESHGRTKPREVQPLADGYNNQGVSLVDLGKTREAERRFQAALRSDPHHPEAAYNLGLLRWRNGEITDVELVEQLREVSASHPDRWIDEYLLAQVHLERGDDQSALKVLESIEDSVADAPEAGRLLAELRANDSVGQCCKWLRTLGGHSDRVTSVALSADGRYALSGSNDNTVRLWDIASGECVQTFQNKHNVSVAFSADSRYVVASNDQQPVRQWDADTGGELRPSNLQPIGPANAFLARELGCFQGNGYCASSVGFSPDGRYIVFGSASGSRNLFHRLQRATRFDPGGPKEIKVRLWDVAKRECVQEFDGHEGTVMSVALSADGRFALSGSNDRTVRLWDVATGENLRTLEGHSGLVSSVAFSPDGRYALSASYDKTVRLWGVTSGECLRQFKGHTDRVTSVACSPDAGYALSGSDDKTVRLWDVATGTCLRTFMGYRAHTGNVTSVTFSSNGRRALSGSSDATVRLWQIGRKDHIKARHRLTRVSDSGSLLQAQADLNRQLRIARTALSNGEFAEAAALLRHSRLTQQNARLPQILELWTDLYTRLPRTKFRGGWHQRTFTGHSDGVTSVSLSADGRIGITGSSDRTVRLWNIDDGTCLRTFKGHYSKITSVSLSADCRIARSGSTDKTVRLWDVEGGKCLKTFEREPGSIRFSADHRYVLSGSEDKPMMLSNVTEGNFLRTFKGDLDAVNFISSSVDGRRALFASKDKTVRLWDVGSGRCARMFVGHTKEVTSVAFSACGRYALSGSDDKTVRLWEVGSGLCPRIFEGHSNSVTSVAFSSDGRYALSGSSDKTMRLWFLDWELEDRETADWDEGARSCLEIFLTLHSPVKELFRPWEKPTWSDSDFQRLMTQLGYTGYGWLRPEGVKRKLEVMAANWTGPPRWLRRQVSRPVI